MFLHRHYITLDFFEIINIDKGVQPRSVLLIAFGIHDSRFRISPSICPSLNGTNNIALALVFGSESSITSSSLLIPSFLTALIITVLPITGISYAFWSLSHLFITDITGILSAPSSFKTDDVTLRCSAHSSLDASQTFSIRSAFLPLRELI